MTTGTTRYAERLARLRALMQENGLGALLVYGNAFRKDDLRYVAPIPTPAPYGFCLLTPEGGELYLEEPWNEAEAPGTVDAVHGARDAVSLARMVGERVRAVGPRVGLVGEEWLEADTFATVEERAGPVEFVPATRQLHDLRLVKDAEEIAAIRQAAALADQGYAAFRRACRPGRAQFEVVAEVEGYLRTVGAEDNFMLIASGGSDVYGMTPPTRRTLQVGDNVITELTPQCGGYYAQICRTLTLGPASPAQRRSFDIFRRAADAAIAVIKPGVTMSEVAKAQNDVFRAEGFGEFCTAEYTRVRGHGVGLFPDDEPVVWEGVPVVAREGMVFIPHPNTYLPLAGYMVFGDTVLVTRDGCELLTSTDRVLFEEAV